MCSLQVSTMLLHPGTVDTDLSIPFQKVCRSLECAGFYVFVTERGA